MDELYPFIAFDKRTWEALLHIKSKRYANNAWVWYMVLRSHKRPLWDKAQALLEKQT